ncbi:hypothetical protein MEX01_51550 [Methylorubrum extorquens]|nr:hypothetical protein MEX01_51550 [Methylorubrum extorquens]
MYIGANFLGFGMSRQVVASLDGLSLAPEAVTICQRIYMLLQRIYDSNDHNTHENKIVELANELMSETKTYDILFLYLYDSLMNLDYGKAVQVGKLLLQHEAMLHDIASEGAIERPSLLN